MKGNLAQRISNFFVNYFSLSGQLVSQEQAEQNIREGVSFRGTNILILVLAILIASLGLNTNSTAVIIGAMLISTTSTLLNVASATCLWRRASR